MLCCAVLLCFSAPAPLLTSSCCTTRHCLVVFTVAVRVLREGARVTWVCWCWLLYAVVVPWCFLPAASRWCAGATKAGLLPAVRPGLVGVDVAEHLVPSCSVHYDVLPCRGWDLAEEEVDFSCRSLLFVVGFVVVAAVAVVAVAVTAVLLGGVAWFACGDDVLLW